MNRLTDVSRFTDIIATSFHATSLTNAFIVEIDSTPPPYPSPLVDFDRRRRHFAAGIQDEANQGAELVEAGDWSAIACWEPPNFKGTPFALTSSSSALRAEWRDRIAAVRPKSPHYHLQFLARNPEIPSVRGAITAIIQPFLDRARAEGVPAWLEAVDEHSVKVYEHFGFRLVEKITLGRGKHNSLGWPEEGGEGFSGWCMIYDV
jgi:hypothetical protein